jgi:Zinc dependent phospholipase C
MRKTILVAGAMLIAIALPSTASAWGTSAHRYIMSRAIDLLPPPLKPLYEKYRDEVVLRATDPDTWRNVGWDEEEPNHFMNFGAPEFGAYPFKALPREYGAAIEKFGLATLKRDGLLPWREAEQFGNLRRAFERFARGGFGAANVVLFSGVASHYIQDGNQPLHATNNYDGQLTGNSGVHSRFEADLFERFQSRLTVTPAAPKAIVSARDAAFDALLSGYQLVDPILKADTDAVAGKDTYDDDYYEKFFSKVKPILEQRLAESITATASVIIGAWEQAGKPALVLDAKRAPQKVRKP